MKFIKVNMNNLQVDVGEVPESYKALGGRALTSSFINDEVKPTAHPLGKNNKLIFAPGLLSGTRAPSSGRLSVGGLSPLTKTIKESNTGGTAAQKLAKLGIRGLVVEDLPKGDDYYLLLVSKDEVKLEVADKELIGLGNYEVGGKLRAKYGDNVTVLSIGQAGEFKMTAASIAVSDPEGRPARHAGRGGLGAVMGSKKIKAIVIDDTGTGEIPLVDADAFKEASKNSPRLFLNILCLARD